MKNEKKIAQKASYKIILELNKNETEIAKTRQRLRAKTKPKTERRQGKRRMSGGKLEKVKTKQKFELSSRSVSLLRYIFICTQSVKHNVCFTTPM